MRKRWKVTYRALSDGREVEIHCSNKVEAEGLRELVLRIDPYADPRIEEDT